MTQQNATFTAVAHPGGGYDPQSRTRPRFLCNAPTLKFYHPMFTRSEVIVLTHKPTNTSTHNAQTNRRRRKHPTFFATLRRWVINFRKWVIISTGKFTSKVFSERWQTIPIAMKSLSFLVCCLPQPASTQGGAKLAPFLYALKGYFTHITVI